MKKKKIAAIVSVKGALVSVKSALVSVNGALVLVNGALVLVNGAFISYPAYLASMYQMLVLYKAISLKQVVQSVL